MKLCIRKVKSKKRGALYTQNDYKKIQMIDAEVIKLDAQVKEEVAVIKDINKRIIDDFQKLERERGLQVRKLVGSLTHAMRDGSTRVSKVFQDLEF